ncbi:MAG: ribosome small subunit-dependent GTPase A [Parvibaculum sp.]|nr:ribosome small subunit-dependent GTPase A [Parvibaculum sp.]
MTETTLADLGWSAHFSSQIGPDVSANMPPARISDIHRDLVMAKSALGDLTLELPSDMRAGDFAVGDWVLCDPESGRIHSLLERRTLLRRKTEGSGDKRQLIAANVDTLLIVSSCNDDFNPARLERYLALAISSGIAPVLVLTKADMASDAGDYKKQAERLLADMPVVILDARNPKSLDQLLPWVKAGQTAALVGSSGVGKSTIMNGLAGIETATQGIRENDAKGRHTTTARSLRRTLSGGWLIDTPGMRSLSMSDNAEGIETLFADVIELAQTCKFSDCSHDMEPGCAIQAAIKKGTLDADRLQRWLKLATENQGNTETPAEARARIRGQSHHIRSATKKKRARPADE